jgi:hypothetical protein
MNCWMHRFELKSDFFGPQIYIGLCCNNNGLENCGPLFTLGWARTEMGLNLEI